MSFPQRGEVVNQHSRAFIGIDTSKLRNAIAVAEEGRDGEVRHLGEIDTTEAAKGNGFDVKILREVIRLRKQDQKARDEQESLLDAYPGRNPRQSALAAPDRSAPARCPRLLAVRRHPLPDAEIDDAKVSLACPLWRQPSWVRTAIVNSLKHPVVGSSANCRVRDQSGEQKERDMNVSKRFYLSTAGAMGFGALMTLPIPAVAQNTVAIDNDDIGGVVNGRNGPEAGVWVIAETNDLPTRFARMVVTNLDLDEWGRPRRMTCPHDLG
jgi:uncharacterized protein (UPF0335 family)